MTVTYDPKHPAYYDQADLRAELTRVYDLCHGCRLCLSLCPSFPTMFNLIDAKDGDVAALTPQEQDQVVDECYQCKLCYVKCPYIPPHEWQLDFPRLMLRAEAARPKSIREKVTTQALARTDQTGKLASLAAPLTNAVLSKPGSPLRRAIDKVTGIAADRVLPPYARTRFSTWFKRRRQAGAERLGRDQQGRVGVFATCMVEYQNPAIGQDLVKVYERNGVSCELAEGAGCCGAPWLHSGDHDSFRKQAEKNVAALARTVREGRDIVVPQPTCGYVLKRDYVDYLATPDAKLVSEHTYDAAEYLWRLHKGEGTELDRDFTGEVPATVAYHVPCHLQAQNIGLRSRDLIKLTGAKVTAIQKCSGIDGTWGLRSENYDLSRKVAGPLRDAIRKADAEVVAGDCHLANGAIVQETGADPVHPLQLLARAYGIPAEAAEGDPR
ncbi:MAG TPA: heterodisulfide reductase-related iron-sulfur binding cluster [Acidimicrobiales bacterium]|nr:heterodisulfide reductase-related iron-sulfur binding cluster [Acidimicrobiales bacterium]